MNVKATPPSSLLQACIEAEAMAGDEPESQPRLDHEYQQANNTQRLASARDKIQASADITHLIVKHAPICIAMFDHDMNYLAASDRWISEYGQGHTDLVGRNCYEVHVDLPEVWKAVHQRGLSGETIKNDEDQWQWCDGTTRWFSWSVFPWVNSRSEIGGIIVFIADITAFKETELKLRASESAFRAAQLMAGVGSWEWDVKTDVHIWSDEIYHIYGRAPSLPPAGYPDVQRYFTPESWARLAAAVEKGMAEGIPYECDAEVIRPDGDRRWITAKGDAIRDAEGTVLALHGTVQDITERKNTEEALRIAAAAFEVQVGIMITDANRVIQRINKTFTEITGYTEADSIGQKPSLLKSGRHNADFYREMWETIDRTGVWQGEIWDRRKNGEVYPTWHTISAVKDNNGFVTHYVGTHYDTTERKQAEDKIQELAFFDQLTGLPNRVLLLDRLKQAMAAGSRSGSHGALLFIDMDNFKTLNDTQGHDSGDLLLKQVALRLTHCIREGDTVARVGGDEFVVVLAGLSTNAAEAAASIETVIENMLSSLEQSYSIGRISHHSTASIGATLFLGHRTTVDELMKQADLAMYRSKGTGRNTWHFFDPDMEFTVNERASLERDLRQAMQEGGLQLNYQPQVDSQGCVTGAEALVRWSHPQRGMVPPADFIALAEETGLILPLGQWILDTVCSQLAEWASCPEMAHVTISVNISARQFCQANFADQVFAVLNRTGANPQRLKLELTEGMLLDNAQGVSKKMSALNGRGVSFSLDDFGTGYSSLPHLKNLPLGDLKIDQSFVHDVFDSPSNAVIIKTVMALAESLGLNVIAEGVETESQRDFLSSVCCHFYQGNLFSRPLSSAEFEKFVRQN